MTDDLAGGSNTEVRSVFFRRPILSWAFYDWANSAFATTVMAGLFPVFLNRYWSAGADGAVITSRLGFASSIASLIIAVLAPVLGAIADRGGARRKFLLGFALLGIVMTGGLYLAQEGEWLLALTLYVVATMGFAGANIFYDSLIVDVAPDEEFDLVSAFGYSLGYLGGGLLFLVNVLMVTHPDWFGLADAAIATRISFLSVAVWWAVFSIPLLLFVPERPTKDRQPKFAAVTAGFRQLARTFREIRSLRVVFLFLMAYWLYIDGVHTVIKMAVNHGVQLGFADSDLLLALLITQFVGFPAALFFGWLGKRIGAKRGILVGIVVYAGVTAWAGTSLSQTHEFYALAVAVGLVQGGVQSLSRSLYARLIPENKAAEFFGFYNMLGKFAAVLGPAMMGAAAAIFDDAGAAILAIIPLFVLGFIILLFVNEREGEISAARMEAV